MKKIRFLASTMRLPFLACLTCLGCLASLIPNLALSAEPKAAHATTAEVLAAATPADWRVPDPNTTLLMEMPSGPVVIELASTFAPHHTASIVALARAGYFDGLAIVRVQDNYVTQWGDPEEDEAKLKAKPKNLPKPPAEFDRPLKGLAFTPLRENDGWAPQEGFVEGWPVAADPKKGRAWLTHCYGMVGAGRGDTVDSSDGGELYAVIGHATRGLDLNITLVGRVLSGMERLSALPRGTGPMGFYEKAEQRTPVTRVRVLADLPLAERPHLEVLRTDTPRFQQYLDSRRYRNGWFVHSPDRVELCSALPPVRTAP